mgnify:CR=1 FL=1
MSIVVINNVVPFSGSNEVWIGKSVEQHCSVIVLSSSIVVLLSGSGTNLQAIMDAGHPFINEGRINVKFVMSDNSKAYGIDRADKKKIPSFVQSDHSMLELHVTD